MPAGGRGRALPSSWRFYAAGPGDPPAASRPAPPAPRRALRFRACPLPPRAAGEPGNAKAGTKRAETSAETCGPH